MIYYIIHGPFDFRENHQDLTSSSRSSLESKPDNTSNATLDNSRLSYGGSNPDLSKQRSFLQPIARQLSNSVPDLRKKKHNRQYVVTFFCMYFTLFVKKVFLKTQQAFISRYSLLTFSREKLHLSGIPRFKLSSTEKDFSETKPVLKEVYSYLNNIVGLYLLQDIL